MVDKLTQPDPVADSGADRHFRIPRDLIPIVVLRRTLGPSLRNNFPPFRPATPHRCRMGAREKGQKEAPAHLWQFLEQRRYRGIALRKGGTGLWKPREEDGSERVRRTVGPSTAGISLRELSQANQ